MKNIKKIIAILLVATISYPNLTVQGDSLNEIGQAIGRYEEGVIEIGKEAVDTQEKVDTDLDLEENGDGDNVDTGGEGEGEGEGEDEVKPEEEGANQELDSDNTADNNEEPQEEGKEIEDSSLELEENKEFLTEDKETDTLLGEEQAASRVKKGSKYEVTTVGEIFPKVYSLGNEAEDVPQEVIEKREVRLGFKVLVPMTEANYEIALAHEDGSYSFVTIADTMEAAVSEVEKLRLEYDNISEIPAVVSNDGQVIYSTNSMGRIWQHRGGRPTPWKEGDTTYNVDVSNIYVNSNYSSAYTYVNTDYIDDVPIISETSTMAKVRVNGYDGWIDKKVDSNDKDYEMIVVPMNQVINPSYYYSSNGALYHYIAKDMTVSGSGNSIKIGAAPLYFKDGVKYFSYDGKYFYEGTSISDGLNKLVADLRNNTIKNAMNSTNPFYNYYTYLPFRTRTNYTAADLDKFINANTQSNSKLRGLGSVFIECQEKYGVNPLLALGVAINESGWGMSSIAQTKNNLFGMNAVDSSPGESANYFKTPGDSVREFTKYYISKGYADPEDSRCHGGYLGNKALGANVKYASDPFWGEKAAQHAFTVDFKLSGENINSLKDYNGYKLAVYNGATEVKNASGTTLYTISGNEGAKGSKGNVVALKFQNATSDKYQIFAERTTVVSTGEYHGDYNWNDNGYVNTGALTFINSPKHYFIPGYAKEDVTKNGVINQEDLDNVSQNYNTFSGDNGFKGHMDINEDTIIDIFDLVNISKKLN